MDAEEREAYCIVERGPRRLALPAAAVRRVLSGGTLMPLPCAPAHVVGLVSDRGAPLPVISLDPWLGAPAGRCRSGEPVLVLECAGQRFGVLVDRVGGVGWLPGGAASAPATAAANGGDVVVHPEQAADGGAGLPASKPGGAGGGGSGGGGRGVRRRARPVPRDGREDRAVRGGATSALAVRRLCRPAVVLP
ncbi:MAG: chemotaxis protein CheW [Candidatus Binatia bacterium]